MAKHKHAPVQGRLVRLVLLGLAGVGLVLLALLKGKDVVLYNPKGLIAQKQFRLMMFSTAVLLAVAIPTLSLLYFFAWKYRETNGKPKRRQTKQPSKFLGLSFWVMPLIALAVLTSAAWPAAHKLDPHQVIASDSKPLTIQVIALRWKWLFIYPTQNIATINYVQLPVNRPVQFDLTADEAPMNSFWIPHLGGQLYAMTGHSNQLNLMATTAGDYAGQAAEINGPGFAGMNFTARATSADDFNQWVQNAKQSRHALDTTEYARLLVPSENVPTAYYTNVQLGLYNTVLAKYGGLHNHTPEQQ